MFDGDLKTEQIVIDRAGLDTQAHNWRARAEPQFDPTTQGLEVLRANLADRGAWAAAHHLFFDTDINLRDFFGGKLKSVEVLNYRSKSDRPMTGADIRKEIKGVWFGKFRDASFNIEWSEGAIWNIDASIVFDDRTQGTFLTDGAHVRVIDRRGKRWFIRLRPAVD